MQTQLLIDGKRLAGEGSAEAVLDPATGEVLVQVPEASPAQVAAAVAAGMRVIGLPDPRMDRGRFARADFVVGSYDEMRLLDLGIREG